MGKYKKPHKRLHIWSIESDVYYLDEPYYCKKDKKVYEKKDLSMQQLESNDYMELFTIDKIQCMHDFTKSIDTDDYTKYFGYLEHVDEEDRQSEFLAGFERLVTENWDYWGEYEKMLDDLFVEKVLKWCEDNDIKYDKRYV